MKKFILIMMVLMSSQAMAEEQHTFKDFPGNSLDYDRLSIAFLAEAYNKCRLYSQRELKETPGISMTRCSCIAEYTGQYVRLSMNDEKKIAIIKEGEEGCNRWMSKMTIRERTQ